MTVTVTVQETPNPNARRFLLDRPVQEEPRGRFYTEAATAEDPLAKALLDVKGVAGVMLLPTSVTVNKAPATHWEQAEPAIRQALERYFA